MSTRMKRLVVLVGLSLALVVQAVPAVASAGASATTAGGARAATQCVGCHGIGMVLPPR